MWCVTFDQLKRAVSASVRFGILKEASDFPGFVIEVRKEWHAGANRGGAFRRAQTLNSIRLAGTVGPWLLRPDRNGFIVLVVIIVTG